MAVTVGASKTFGGTEHSTSQNSNLVQNPCFVTAIFGFSSEIFFSGHSLIINYSDVFCKLQFPSFCTRSLLWKLSSHIFFASWHTGSSKERMATIRRMIFQKSSKWPLSQRLWPPPLFQKKTCCNFSSSLNFMLKKSCLKVQNLQHEFLDWKWPSPLEVFRKFIHFVRSDRPSFGERKHPPSSY